MARKPRLLGSYPESYFGIIEDAIKNQYVQVPMRDRKMAYSTAHDFNRFKLAMIRERHPHYAIAQDLIVRIENVGTPGKEGKYVLEFVRRGMAILADESRGSRRGIPSDLREEERLEGFDELLDPSARPLQEPQEPQAVQRFLRNVGAVAVGEDEGDKKLREILGHPKLVGDKAEEDENSKAMRALAEEARKVVDSATCTHEWDVTDTHCMKCKAPKEDSGSVPK